MDPERCRVLSNFYREEFKRHIDQLRANGIGSTGERETVDRALDSLDARLRSGGSTESFDAVAERLLRNFDALTRLSLIDDRRGH